METCIDEFNDLYYECLRNGYHFTKGSFNFCEFLYNLEEESKVFDDSKLMICISVDEDKTKDDTKELEIFPETLAISVTFCGKYEDSFLAHQVLLDYIKNHNITDYGYLREYYIEGDLNNSGDDNIVKIIVPIKNNN